MRVCNMYEEYAMLKIQISKLSEEADALVPQIIEQMQNEGTSKFENSMGAFKITNLKKWKYPIKIIEAEEMVKAEKAKAQSTGDATFEEVPSLTFRVIKL